MPVRYEGMCHHLHGGRSGRGGRDRTVVPFLSGPEEQKLCFQRREPLRYAPWFFPPKKTKKEETGPRRAHRQKRAQCCLGPPPLCQSRTAAPLARWLVGAAVAVAVAVPLADAGAPHCVPTALRCRLQSRGAPVGAGLRVRAMSAKVVASRGRRQHARHGIHSCCGHILRVLMVSGEFVSQTAAQSASIANRGAADFRRSF